MSYSAYLWHQPIFAFARIRFAGEVSVPLFILLILVTFALAFITWKFIETPARQGGRKPLKVLLYSGVCSIALGLIGLLGWGTNGHTSNNAVAADFIRSRGDVSPLRDKCHATATKAIDPTEACVLGENGKGRVYLWGDSHGVELSYALSEKLAQGEYSVTQFTGSQCIATPSVESGRENHCVDHNQRVWEYLTNAAEPGLVILVSRWPLYISGDRVDLGGACVEGKDFAGRFVTEAKDGSSRKQALGKAISQTVDRLTKSGQRVVFLHAFPEPGCNVPEHLARSAMFSGVSQTDTDVTFPALTHVRRMNEVESVLRISSSDDVLVIDPTDILCTSGVCRYGNRDGLYYFDNNHPSLHGAAKIADKIVSDLEQRNWIN